MTGEASVRNDDVGTKVGVGGGSKVEGLWIGLFGFRSKVLILS